MSHRNHHFRVLFVTPPADWKPTTPGDIPTSFQVNQVKGGISANGRCGLNIGVIQAHRFNQRAIAAGSYGTAWAIVVCDREDREGGKNNHEKEFKSPWK